jgi:hypothetical protein
LLRYSHLVIHLIILKSFNEPSNEESGGSKIVFPSDTVLDSHCDISVEARAIALGNTDTVILVQNHASLFSSLALETYGSNRVTQKSFNGVCEDSVQFKAPILWNVKKV